MRALYFVCSCAMLAVGLFGCGGGGGGGGSSSGGGGSGGGSANTPAPVISGLHINPPGLYLGADGRVDLQFSYAGATGGAASATFVILDSMGNILSNSNGPITGGAGQASGIVISTLNFDTSAIGNFSFRITLADVSGHVSNMLTGPFRVANQPWVAKAAMPHARNLFAVAAAGGLAYVIGGELLNTGTTPGPDSALVEVYNPATDAWAAGVALPTARKAPVAATVNGVIYVIGGFNAGNPGGLGTVEAFDPLASSWTTKTSMPTARSSAAAAVVGGRICVFGGTSGGLDVATTECFDPAANSWASEPAMPTARHALGSDALGPAAYAVGGAALTSPSGFVSTVERFDGANWSSSASMSLIRANVAVVGASGLLYVIGGNNTIAALSSVEAFDPASGTWTIKTDMPTSLTQLGGVTIGGLIYVFEQSHSFQYTPSNDVR